jgi:hypothetical protein
MLIETSDIVTYDKRLVSFEQYYIFNCMFLSQVGLSWLYLMFRIIERLTFYILYDGCFYIYPFVDQVRIYIMEYIMQTEIRLGSRNDIEKPKFEREDKYFGPCVPLKSKCVQVIYTDPTKVSLQTAYGMLGENWKYLGQKRLSMWSLRMDNDIAVATTTPEEISASKHKKRANAKRYKDRWSKKPHHNSKTAEKARRKQKKKDIKDSVQEPMCLLVKAVGNMSDLFQQKGSNKVNELLWDTGATLTVTPHLNDFVSPLNTTSQPKIMKGIAKGLSIEGIGTVEYKVHDDAGKPYIIRTQAYYTPEAKRRIFSPQSFLQDDGGKGVAIQTKNEIKLQLDSQVFTYYIIYFQWKRMFTSNSC